MTSLLNAILVIVLVMNLFALGASRIRAVIRIVAAQGAILGVIPLLVSTHLSLATVLVVVATIAIKGVTIPGIMMRALRDTQIKREVEPLISRLSSTVLGAAAILLALLFADVLPLAAQHEQLLLVPASMATVLVGFILVTTRFAALNQVVGYLVLENGIFIFGMLLVEAMPLVVEL
ncbi:MAG: hydrogenase, partial [Humidesulfovibrio sp.]|nr:hydrogenase [Humidesulfovibrio sp.]